MPALNPIIPNKGPIEVWIVEGTDTKHLDKYTRKEVQHDQLQEVLKRRGFDVEVLPIIVGFTGTIYRITLTALSELGIDKPQAKKLLHELRIHAVQTHHHTIVKLKRKLARRQLFPWKAWESSTPKKTRTLGTIEASIA